MLNITDACVLQRDTYTTSRGTRNEIPANLFTVGISLLTMKGYTSSRRLLIEKKRHSLSAVDIVCDSSDERIQSCDVLTMDLDEFLEQSGVGKDLLTAAVPDEARLAVNFRFVDIS